MTDSVVVCVPARDEAERLPLLLRSLDAQIQLDRPLRVVIVVNNSRDGTADSARRLAASGAIPALALRISEVSLAAALAHVGTARRMALDEGAAWLAEDDAADGVLMSTDADARVPPDWITANIAALEKADIVGGRLVIERDQRPDERRVALDASIERYWSAVRGLEGRIDPPAHDPEPRHGDHTGASLALRASLYRRVGGLPPLPRGEDNAMVAAVTDAGGRLRHCPRVTVTVSDRVIGRAVGGMAGDMARREQVLAGGDAYLLPSPEHWRVLFGRRAALRSAWRSGEVGQGGATAGLTEKDHAAIGACPNDIAFVERASRRLESRDAPPVPIPLQDALAAFDRIGRDMV